ncbi:hypothetical protein BJ912DRAFT_1147918, partial [Pholiota molesta]
MFRGNVQCLASQRVYSIRYMIHDCQDYHDTVTAVEMSNTPHILAAMFALDDHEKTMIIRWTRIFWGYPVWLERIIRLMLWMKDTEEPPSTIKAEHGCGSTKVTRRYTRGNTCGSSDPRIRVYLRVPSGRSVSWSSASIDSTNIQRGDFSYLLTTRAHRPRSSATLTAPTALPRTNDEGRGGESKGRPGSGRPTRYAPLRIPPSLAADHHRSPQPPCTRRGATARPPLDTRPPATSCHVTRPRRRATSPARDVVPRRPHTTTTAPHCPPRRPAAHDTTTTKAPPLPRHRAAAHAHNDNGHPTPAMSPRPAPRSLCTWHAMSPARDIVPRRPHTMTYCPLCRPATPTTDAHHPYTPTTAPHCSPRRPAAHDTMTTAPHPHPSPAPSVRTTE